MKNQEIPFQTHLRNRATTAERHLWTYLRKKQLGVKFRRQHPISRCVADFCCLPLKLIVELDGQPHVSGAEQDRARDAWLRAQGYQVLRFWNQDALHATDQVLEKIKTTVSERKKLFASK